MKQSSMMKMIIIQMVIFTILTIIELVIYIKTLLWIYELEKIDCKCSENVRRDYIKYWIQFYIGFSIIMYLYYIIYGAAGAAETESKIFSGVKLIVGIFSLTNLILSIQYIENLKKTQCKCSENEMREVYYIFNWIRVALLILVAILFIVVVAMLLYKYSLSRNGVLKKTLKTESPNRYRHSWSPN